MNAAELHRIHASPAAGKGGNSVDIGASRWRGEGGTSDIKRGVARRIAVAWNVCEGWRTEDLERGVLCEVDQLAVDLVNAVLHGTRELAEATALRLRDALSRRDGHQDLRDGRPADCERCYPLGADDDTEDIDGPNGRVP